MSTKLISQPPSVSVARSARCTSPRTFSTRSLAPRVASQMTQTRKSRWGNSMITRRPSTCQAKKISFFPEERFNILESHSIDDIGISLGASTLLDKYLKGHIGDTNKSYPVVPNRLTKLDFEIDEFFEIPATPVCSHQLASPAVPSDVDVIHEAEIAEAEIALLMDHYYDNPEDFLLDVVESAAAIRNERVLTPIRDASADDNTEDWAKLLQKQLNTEVTAPILNLNAESTAPDWTELYKMDVDMGKKPSPPAGHIPPTPHKKPQDWGKLYSKELREFKSESILRPEPKIKRNPVIKHSHSARLCTNENRINRTSVTGPKTASKKLKDWGKLYAEQLRETRSASLSPNMKSRIPGGVDVKRPVMSKISRSASPPLAKKCRSSEIKTKFTLTPVRQVAPRFQRPASEKRVSRPFENSSPYRFLKPRSASISKSAPTLRQYVPQR